VLSLFARGAVRLLLLFDELYHFVREHFARLDYVMAPRRVAWSDVALFQ
jgi:hypothetical protein